MSGRRVVVLYQLPKSLDSGCNTCAEPLKLSSMITDKTLSGLGSFLYITCCDPDCGEINACHTNKTERVTDTSRGQPNFDLNTNAAANPDSFYLICVRIVMKYISFAPFQCAWHSMDPILKLVPVLARILNWMKIAL